MSTLERGDDPGEPHDDGGAPTSAGAADQPDAATTPEQAAASDAEAEPAAPGTADDGASTLERSEDFDGPRAEAGEPDGSDGSDGSGTSGEPVDALDAPEIRVDRTRVRRAPRYGRFALVGGVLGIVVAFLLTPLARFENLDVPWHFDPWGLALVMAAILAPVGILLGCVVALVADRRSRRGTRP